LNKGRNSRNNCNTCRKIILMGILFFLFISNVKLAYYTKFSKIIINPNDNLQETLNKAPPNSVIELLPGTYKESISITKNITLIGFDPKKVIIESSKRGYPVILINGSRKNIFVKIKNLTITGAFPYRGRCKFSPYVCPHGIVIIGKANVNISNLYIRDNRFHGIAIYDYASLHLFNVSIIGNWHGVFLTDKSTIKAKNVKIIGSGGDCIFAEKLSKVVLSNVLLKGSGWAGLHMKGASNATLLKSYAFQNVYGIHLHDYSNVKIIESKIYENREGGILLENNSSINIEKSEIMRNGEGIRLKDSSKLKMDKSFITENLGDGVYLSGNSEGIISNSTIRLNKRHGVFLTGYSKLRISYTKVMENEWGVVVYLRKCGKDKDEYLGMKDYIKLTKNIINKNKRDNICIP